MGLFDIFGGNANSFRAVGPDGRPINQIGQSGFQAQQLPQFGFAPAMQQSLQNAQQNQAGQQSYIDMLRQQSTGQGGPSVAQGLLQQGIDKSNAGAASTMAGARGMNPGLAAKMAMDQMGQNNQAGAQSAALLRSQEMLGNQAMLGNALGQQGQQNLGMFGSAGQLNQGQNQLGLGVQGLNAQTAMGNAQLQNQGLGMNAGITGQNAQNESNLWGGIIGGLGSAGAAFAGAAHGARVPGHASVPGDSKKNDKVPALLSPGEVVIPRSASDSPEKAAAFVRHLREKEGKDKSEKGEGKDGKPSLEHLHKRVSHLEKMLACGGYA